MLIFDIFEPWLLYYWDLKLQILFYGDTSVELQNIICARKSDDIPFECTVNILKVRTP